MLNKAREHQVISLCQELIGIPSYSGQEGRLADVLKDVFQELKFDDILEDQYGNVVGHIRGNRSGPVLLLDGHLDTVPVDDAGQWQRDPFGGQIKEGRIYGRGASDMKGAISAMVNAAAYFLQDTQRQFAGDIYVAGVVHEECFEGVAARSVSAMVKPDYVIVGEASSLDLKVGQRGRAEIVVETYGKPAHSASPEKGINAVYNMMRIIEAFKALPRQHHNVLGEGILELTDIKSAPYPGASVVPSYCRATYDRRLLVGETKETVLQPLQEVLRDLSDQDPQFNAHVSFALGEEVCYTGARIKAERFFPGWLFTQEQPFVQQVLQGLKKAGLSPTITQYAFCTNGSHYAGEAGIKTLGFGPSPENLAHINDEYISIEQLLGAARGYYAIMDTLLQGERV